MLNSFILYRFIYIYIYIYVYYIYKYIYIYIFASLQPKLLFFTCMMWSLNVETKGIVKWVWCLKLPPPQENFSFLGFYLYGDMRSIVDPGICIFGVKTCSALATMKKTVAKYSDDHICRDCSEYQTSVRPLWATAALQESWSGTLDHCFRPSDCSGVLATMRPSRQTLAPRAGG